MLVGDHERSVMRPAFSAQKKPDKLCVLSGSDAAGQAGARLRLPQRLPQIHAVGIKGGRGRPVTEDPKHANIVGQHI